MSFLLLFIYVCHITFILFIVIVPLLTNISWLFLLLHFVSVLNLLMHWCMNSNVCALTLMECAVRGIPMNESFIHSIVAPVYDFDSSKFDNFIWIMTIVLGCISGYRIYEQRNRIKAEIPIIINFLYKKGNDKTDISKTNGDTKI